MANTSAVVRALAAGVALLAVRPVLAQADDERDPIELWVVPPAADPALALPDSRAAERTAPAPGDETLGVPAPESVTTTTPHAPSVEPFSTRHAWYVPVAWEQLPQWRDAVTPAAWRTFVASCSSLRLRPVWRYICDRALATPMASPDAARRFFEREFTAFQIRAPDLADTGILTGYFEPLLEGSRVRTARFRHPIYALPDDLLFLDARLLTARHPLAHVRVERRDVVPADAPMSRAGETKRYRLAVWRAPAVLRDQKIRVRVNGDRIVPYFTRQEIEQRGLASARALAWVANPDDLYTLHIEGSGRVRLPTGEIVRVGFSEQNGHAFRPIVNAVSADQAAVATAGTPTQGLIDLIFSPATAAEPVAPTLPASPPRIFVSSRDDPSYVFFREIRYTDAGPPGAMGIPLTPGGSLAVDPRVTPLGAPVFIATRPAGAKVTTYRLMTAQDTGGAIRGPLRADYFLGFGASAGAAAMRMKDELRMWVLLPKDLPQTRSGSRRALRDCVVADPEFCAD